jgi:hypothetical protein
MKKTLLLLLVFFFFQKALPQAPVVFCPAGAEWYYSFSVFWTAARHNEEIKYIRDSVVDSETVKVLGHKRLFYYKNFSVAPWHTLIRQRGDTVFFRNASTQHSWQILYNYATQAGQTWTTTIKDPMMQASSTTYTIVVDSVKTVMLNNMSLRKLFVKYIPGPEISVPTRTAEVSERIGCHTFLFNYIAPLYATDADRCEGILCYEDATFGLKQFTDKDCTYEYYVGLEENKADHSGIYLYPNPNHGTFSLRIPNGAGLQDPELSISDLSGREIMHQQLSSLLEQQIELKDLSKGIYLLSIKDQGKIVYTDKIVKHE